MNDAALTAVDWITLLVSNAVIKDRLRARGLVYSVAGCSPKDVFYIRLRALKESSSLLNCTAKI